jgi:hypothetical protein
LDQGGPFSRSLTVNLLNCKKHLPHLSPLFLQEFYIWSLFYHLIIYGVLGQSFEFWTALGMAMLATLMKGTATDTRWILIWSQNLRRQGFLSLAGMKAVNAWRYDCQHFSWRLTMSWSHVFDLSHADYRTTNSQFFRRCTISPWIQVKAWQAISAFLR